MIHRPFFCTTLGLLLLLLGSTVCLAAELHVSPKGDDGNPGTAEKPLRNFSAAQKAVRAIKAAGPVTVWFHAGVYYLPETAVLTADDSGTQAAPITYAAAAGEEAVISGGMKLEPKWEPYRDGIMKTAVPSGMVIDQLFVNGERQILARYPNFDLKAQYFDGCSADCLSPQRVARWADPKGGYIHAMQEAFWGSMHYTITGKDANGKLTYEGGWQNNRPTKMHGSVRFVENIFEELDAPGEWFHDSKNNLLYFYPPKGMDLGTAVVETVRLRSLIEFHGDEKNPVRFVNLKGFTFRHAARTFMETREPLQRSDWRIYRGGALFFQGTEDCAVEDCLLDQLGGNAIFVSNYNRRFIARGCQIEKSGASGVAFVGDPDAVRDSQFNYGSGQQHDKVDRTPGPKTNNYPADCTVEDCLIHLVGRVEKQVAGVEISTSQGITVRHCSIYDVPRSGINIGDGCWGGHLIEFCDVFDTVKETGDHGSFNSWGRDRYWGLGGADPNKMAEGPDSDLPRLDAVKPNVLRNSRWRCDHGWDIDLDDGSTNYEIYNNLCLHGGLKNREGFYRLVENNVIVNNSFHPHVWFKGSGDIFRHNIVFSPYQPIGVGKPWGKEVDFNLVHKPGESTPTPATVLQSQSGRDEHSIIADAMFIDPEKGDYRVKDGSPALALGFKNFPMDQFGVQSARLRSIARTPVLPGISERSAPVPAASERSNASAKWLGATVKNVVGLGEMSVAGLGREMGVRIVEVPEKSRAAQIGLVANDVILKCNGHPTDTVPELFNASQSAIGKGKVPMEIWRHQKSQMIDVELSDGDHVGILSQESLEQPTAQVRVVIESRDDREFSSAPKVSSTGLAHGRPVEMNGHSPNEKPGTLTDGKLADNYGPIFGNGVTNGRYKLDLGKAADISQINTYSFNQGDRRGHQKFTLYGSTSAEDPGWNIDDAKQFTLIARIDSTSGPTGHYECTSIRGASNTLGQYRWLVWAVSPVNESENTAYQEFEVIPAAGH